jgi:hypothetical protein
MRQIGSSRRQLVKSQAAPGGAGDSFVALGPKSSAETAGCLDQMLRRVARLIFSKNYQEGDRDRVGRIDRREDEAVIAANPRDAGADAVDFEAEPVLCLEAWQAISPENVREAWRPLLGEEWK